LSGRIVTRFVGKDFDSRLSVARPAPVNIRATRNHQPEVLTQNKKQETGA
jgi:hypothetical protein